MFTFLVVATSVVFLLLILVAGMRPRSTSLSDFELQRRAKSADSAAKRALRRQKLLPDVLALQRVVLAVLLVTFALLAVATFGWAIGLGAVAIVVLVYGALGTVVAPASGKLYSIIEPSLLRFAKKAHGVLGVIRGLPGETAQWRIGSREELQQLIDDSAEVLTDDERLLIVHGLAFSKKTVKSIMTPKKDMKTIKKSEFLGPLVLSELHELGYSRLPVIGDNDRVIGVLHLRDLLSLDVKRSVTAEKAMEDKVYTIRDNDTLEHALAALLKTRCTLLIVVNEQRETIGLVTLEDVIEALFGRRILDTR